MKLGLGAALGLGQALLADLFQCDAVTGDSNTLGIISGAILVSWHTPSASILEAD